MLPISQLLLTRFWWNFKCRFMGTSRTDSMVTLSRQHLSRWHLPITQHQQYLSCYWPDFDETLNVDSWEHLEQILNPILSKPQPNLNTRLGLTIKWLYTTTPPHPPTHRNSMSAISQLLLTRFWWNFKGRFLWTFRTDSNCQGDICPRDICPYQEYLSCYWPDFDETLPQSSQQMKLNWD